MKHIIVFFAALLLGITASAQSGKNIYQKYSDAENVSAVYVSPAMFRMIGQIPDLEVGADNVNLSSVIRTLSGLYILNSENASINSALRADAERFVNSSRYELLMEAKDSGQTVRMYTVGNDKTIEGFVMISVDDGEVTFICLDGQMPRKDFEELVAKEMSK
jgi:hypothetical protein